MSNPSLSITDMANAGATSTDNTGVTTTPEVNLTELQFTEDVGSTTVASTEDGPVGPQPAAVPEEKPKDKTSSRFAALARKDKDLRAKQQEADKRAADLEAREAAIKEREARWDMAKKRPIEALKELGFTYADVTQDVMGGYEPPKVDPMDERINPVKDALSKQEAAQAKLEAELKAVRDQLTHERRQAAYEAGIKSIRDTLTNTERYELVSTMGEEGVELVRDTVVEYWDRYNKELSIEEAADLVEKYYEKEYLEKIAATKKLQSRVASKAPATTQAAPKEVKEPKPTLSNSLNTAPKQTPDIDSMSKTDAIAFLAKQLNHKDIS